MMFRGKPKRRALRQYESAEALRLAWRELIGAAGEPVPACVYPAVTAYAEQWGAFARPDWSGIVHEYPLDADEQPPTQWGGEATLRPWQVTP